jgi:hypothetical protein
MVRQWFGAACESPVTEQIHIWMSLAVPMARSPWSLVVAYARRKRELCSPLLTLHQAHDLTVSEVQNVNRV